MVMYGASRPSKLKLWQAHLEGKVLCRPRPPRFERNNEQAAYLGKSI